MPDGTHRIDATLKFTADKQADAQAAHAAMTGCLPEGASERGDKLVYEHTLDDKIEVTGTMRFPTEEERDALESELVNEAKNAIGHRISTHYCKHISGKSCDGPIEVIEGGDLGAR